MRQLRARMAWAAERRVGAASLAASPPFLFCPPSPYQSAPPRPPWQRSLAGARRPPVTWCSDASVIPGRGAPTRVAIVSGFTEGWYELAHASGRADRVTWDAGKMPHLFVYGEFGGTDEEPFRGQFYTLALQPMSSNPYLRSTAIF